jgi:hypothetical protein
MQRKDPAHRVPGTDAAPATAGRPAVSVNPAVRRRRIAAVRTAMRRRNRNSPSLRRAQEMP